MPETRCGFDDIPGGASGSTLLVSYGPTLIVDIGFDANFKLGVPAIPMPGIQGLHALIDTGATTSCIDGLLAAHLQNYTMVYEGRTGTVTLSSL